MLLKIVGDAPVLGQIRASNQEPLIVVDPSLPFANPATSAKFAALLGCDPSSSFGALGLSLHHGIHEDKKALLDLERTPEEQGLRSGAMLYCTRESKPFAYPLSSSASLAQFGAESAHDRSQSPTRLSHAAERAPVFSNAMSAPASAFDRKDTLPGQVSNPWDITSQMEEAVARRKAQQIMGDFLQYKTRADELDAELKKLRAERDAQKDHIMQLEAKVAIPLQQEAQSEEADQLRLMNFDLKRDSLELQKANTIYAKKEAALTKEVRELKQRIDEEVEKGRRDLQTQVDDLDEELKEANTFITALKERLIAQAAELKREQVANDEEHTEHIILPPGMLRKLVTVTGGGMQYYREKFNVKIELLDNTLTVAGDTVDIKLLRDEVEERLGLAQPIEETDPEYVKQLLMREQELLAINAEQKHEVAAAKHTIDSLHVALQHAQERIDTDLESTKELRQIQSREAVKNADEVVKLTQATDALRAELEAKSNALATAEEALKSTMDTFELEFERTRHMKEETNLLRLVIEKKEEEVREAEQQHYLVKERLAQVTLANKELLGKLGEANQSAVSVPHLERQLEETKEELKQARGETLIKIGEWGTERGILVEKNQRLQDALDASVLKLEETKQIREALKDTKDKNDELQATIERLKGTTEAGAVETATTALQEKTTTIEMMQTEQAALKQVVTTLEEENKLLKGDYLLLAESNQATEAKVAALLLQIEDGRVAKNAEIAAIVATAQHREVEVAHQTADTLRAEMRVAALRQSPVPAVPHPTEAAALVESIRAELEAKKVQLAKSQALLTDAICNSPPLAKAFTPTAASPGPAAYSPTRSPAAAARAAASPKPKTPVRKPFHFS
eukprot:TRINITY_DN18768_c0_g1_i1.p1 TRINITY_DN18768_c0_g1~~TRINITY_DN18768_c0_g1_i1.p1  ORF type:complete len:858 (+),score=372.39 TRINITY_DN18768_c0_g1_i1:86-2659(+)